MGHHNCEDTFLLTLETKFGSNPATECWETDFPGWDSGWGSANLLCKVIVKTNSVQLSWSWDWAWQNLGEFQPKISMHLRVLNPISGGFWNREKSSWFFERGVQDLGPNFGQIHPLFAILWLFVLILTFWMNENASFRQIKVYYGVIRPKTHYKSIFLWRFLYCNKI